MLAAAFLLQCVIVIAAPLLLAIQLRKRWTLSWWLFTAGALTFAGSQAAHLPLNHFVLPRVMVLSTHLSSGTRVAYHALLLGLSAGVCEEVARFVALRFALRNFRTGPHALMFGAGHGGIESIFVGLFAASAAFNVLYLQRFGVDNLGLSTLDAQAVRQWMTSSPWLVLLGALERLMTIPFHIAAATLVMASIAKRRPLLLVVAIAWHTILDAGVVWTFSKFGAVMSEVWLAVCLPINLLIIGANMKQFAVLSDAQASTRPESSGEPIEFVEVEKSFGDVHALRGVSVMVKRGERVCLLGPNGAGKTTAIRIVNGALAPTNGWAFLFGSNAEDDQFLVAKRRVGVVPQQAGMYREMTCRQYLDFVKEIYGSEPYEHLIDRLSLGDVMDRSSATLSGGMQRRLSLAAALLSSPDLLILDEPSAGLDPIAAHEMIELLKDVSEGRTTLLCTHDLDEAEKLCDSVIILRAGRVLLHQSIAELRKQSTPMLALRTVGDVAPLRRALEAQGHTVQETDDTQEVTIAFPQGAQGAPHMLRTLLEQGVDVCECRILRPTLEALFIETVRTAEAASIGKTKAQE